MDATNKNADLVEVLRVQGSVEADVIRSFLESQGISCLIRGRMAQFIYPLTVDGLAEYKILVPAADAPAARALIESRPQDSEI
jgi:hypothetical protein